MKHAATNRNLKKTPPQPIHTHVHVYVCAMYNVYFPIHELPTSKKSHHPTLSFPKGCDLPRSIKQMPNHSLEETRTAPACKAASFAKTPMQCDPQPGPFTPVAPARYRLQCDGV